MIWGNESTYHSTMKRQDNRATSQDICVCVCTCMCMRIGWGREGDREYKMKIMCIAR